MPSPLYSHLLTAGYVPLTGAPVSGGSYVLYLKNATSGSNGHKRICIINHEGPQDGNLHPYEDTANNTTIVIEEEVVKSMMCLAPTPPISCAGAQANSGCITLSGAWDVEIAGVRVLTDVESEDLISLLPIANQLAVIACTGGGCSDKVQLSPDLDYGLPGNSDETGYYPVEAPGILWTVELDGNTMPDQADGSNIYLEDIVGPGSNGQLFAGYANGGIWIQNRSPDSHTLRLIPSTPPDSPISDVTNNPNFSINQSTGIITIVLCPFDGVNWNGNGEGPQPE